MSEKSVTMGDFVKEHLESFVHVMGFATNHASYIGECIRENPDDEDMDDLMREMQHAMTCIRYIVEIVADAGLTEAGNEIVRRLNDEHGSTPEDVEAIMGNLAAARQVRDARRLLSRAADDKPQA